MNGGAIPAGPHGTGPADFDARGGAPRTDAASVEIVVDGRAVTVEAGITLAAALWNAGVRAFRRSVTGQPRAPVCGMGICFECRVTVDDTPHVRSCMAEVRADMRVRTDSLAGPAAAAPIAGLARDADAGHTDG